MGIQPDILIARSENPLDKRIIDRFAMFCNMKSEDIISNPDVNSVYEIPLTLYKQNVHNLILSKLSLKKSKTNITEWLDAEEVERKGVKIIGKPDGIIVPIGWGERGAEGMITAAGYARKNKIPYLGLCYGLQHAVISFARDVLKLKNANTTENDKKTKYPVIDLIPSQKQVMKNRAYGGTMRLGAWDAKVQKDTKTYFIYKKYKAFRNE